MQKMAGNRRRIPGRGRGRHVIIRRPWRSGICSRIRIVSDSAVSVRIIGIPIHLRRFWTRRFHASAFQSPPLDFVFGDTRLPLPGFPIAAVLFQFHSPVLEPNFDLPIAEIFQIFSHFFALGSSDEMPEFVEFFFQLLHLPRLVGFPASGSLRVAGDRP